MKGIPKHVLNDQQIFELWEKLIYSRLTCTSSH